MPGDSNQHSHSRPAHSSFLKNRKAPPLIPTLVDREDMPNAIALNSIQFNLAVTVGPALAGITLARLGEKWCFGLNSVSFLAPVISLT